MRRSSFGQRWLCLCALALFASLSACPGALAQTSASGKAAAEALFDEGMRLSAKGDFEGACKKFEDSERIDSGIGTMLYLGDCYEKIGKTASAWATFRSASSRARSAGQTERARAGAERADKLEPKLIRLSIEVAPETKQLPDLQVKRGEEVVVGALLGTAVPVDPGSYVIRATAPGYVPFETTISVSASQPVWSVQIPALEPDPEAPAAAVPVATSTSSTPPPKDAAPRSGQTQRIVGLSLGGLGAAGLVLGGVFGILAIDENQRALAAGCDDSSCPNASGQDLSNQAFDHATLSTVFFITGGVLAATGATLYFTAPKSPERVAMRRLGVAPLHGGLALSLGGSF